MNPLHPRLAALRRAAACAVAALAACTVGPSFQAPPSPAADRYTPGPRPLETAAAAAPGGEAQRFTDAWNLSAQWWTVFGCEDLDRLVAGALAASPSVGQARARLVQAREDLNARSGENDPQVDANLYARRQRINPQALGLTSVPNPGPFTLYNATVSVSYVLDLFGGRRRDLEAFGAEVEYQRYELAAAQLALAANIVTAAVREASLREQLDRTRRIIAAQEQEASIAGERVRIGSGAPAEAAVLRGELAQSRAGEQALSRQLERTRHQLALYAGRGPEEVLPEFRLDALRLPVELPVSLPSALARQRPDIRAAEALLHRASATVGAATANLYPQITLSALAGSQTVHAASLFAGGTEVWNFGAGLLQPLFHGGELRAQRRSAIAAYDQAMEAYRQAVLLGLQNVADALRALQDDALTLQARADASAQARYVFETAAGQYRIGAASRVRRLAAQRQLDQTLLQEAQARADRLADTAALIEALGGGWWTAPEASLAP